MPETSVNPQDPQGGFRTAALSPQPQEDQGSRQDPFEERLPPGPGQIGWKPEQQQPQEIPFGFQQLERSINPYIPTALNPSLRDRSANDWGTPDYVLNGMNNYADGELPQGQYVPTERDIPGIIHNATMVLGRFGPPTIGMPMINAGRSFLAAQQAYNGPAFQKGALQAAQLNERQAILQMKITENRLQEMLRRYSAVFHTFGPDESGKDYNADKLHQHVGDLAREYGDHYMLNLLNTKDWGAVDRHLKNLDGVGQDVSKTNQLINLERNKLKLKQEQQEQEESDRTRKEWGVDSVTPTTVGQPAAGQPVATSPTAPRPSAATGEEPSPTPTAEPTAEPTAGAKYTVPQAPERVSKAAQQLQMGEKPALPTDPKVVGAVDAHRAKLDDYMQNLIGDQKLTPDEIKARIRAVNPALGNTVQELLDGVIEPTSTASIRPEIRLAAGLAHRIDPNWMRNSQKVKSQKDMEARKAEVGALRTDLGQVEKNRSMLRSVIVKNVSDMHYLLKLADKLKQRGLDSQIPIINNMIRRGDQELTGDPDLAAFFAQLRTVRSDSGRIMSTGSSGTGAVYPVSAQKEAEKFFPPGVTYGQLEAITKVLKRDYSNKLQPITDEVNQLHGRINERLGTQPPAPASDADIERALTAEDVRVVGGKTYYLRNGKWHDD